METSKSVNEYLWKYVPKVLILLCWNKVTVIQDSKLEPKMSLLIRWWALRPLTSSPFMMLEKHLLYDWKFWLKQFSKMVCSQGSRGRHNFRSLWCKKPWQEHTYPPSLGWILGCPVWCPQWVSLTRNWLPTFQLDLWYG